MFETKTPPLYCRKDQARQDVRRRRQEIPALDRHHRLQSTRLDRAEYQHSSNKNGTVVAFRAEPPVSQALDVKVDTAREP